MDHYRYGGESQNSLFTGRTKTPRDQAQLTGKRREGHRSIGRCIPTSHAPKMNVVYKISLIAFMIGCRQDACGRKHAPGRPSAIIHGGLVQELNPHLTDSSDSPSISIHRRCALVGGSPLSLWTLWTGLGGAITKNQASPALSLLSQQSQITRPPSFGLQKDV